MDIDNAGLTILTYCLHRNISQMALFRNYIVLYLLITNDTHFYLLIQKSINFYETTIYCDIYIFETHYIVILLNERLKK